MRKIMVGVLCFSGSLAFADDATKAAKVEEFFRLSKMDQTVSQALALATNQIKSGLLQQMMGSKLPAAQEKSMAEFQEKVTHLVADALAWEKIEPAYLKIYMDAYTEAELDDIVTFYKSPTGQSMVNKSSILLTKSTEVSQQKMMEAMPAIQKLIREFTDQSKK